MYESYLWYLFVQKNDRANPHTFTIRTIQFSPSRRHLLQREEAINKKKCVLCNKYPTQKSQEHVARKADLDENNIFQQLVGLSSRMGRRTDDNIMDDDDDDDVLAKMNSVAKDEEKGLIVELDEEICRASGSDCCHFAHERCIEIWKRETDNQVCPRCHDLSSRIHSPCAGIKNKKIYCQEIGTTLTSCNGFTASTKIEKAIEWSKAVPKDEKAIILSFFKGSLDLVDILVHDLGIQCVRYDGDSIAPNLLWTIFVGATLVIRL